MSVRRFSQGKIKKPRLSVHRHREKKNKVGPFEENHWITHYGGVVISEAYEGEGGVWLVAARSKYALPHNPDYGLVCLDENAWGVVDRQQLARLKESGEIEGRFEDKLPCTLRELFEGTLVWTYFS